MSNLVVKDNPVSEADLQLIKDTVAKGANDSEFRLFMARAKSMGVNPLVPGQIHFVKIKDYPGTIIVGIGVQRKVAARTGKHEGTNRGVLRDATGKLIGGWAEIFKSGCARPFREEVPMAEYAKDNKIWREMPETMIKKCAEAAALRIAFPDELDGVLGEDERLVSEPNQPVAQIARHVEPQIENLTDRPEFESVIETESQEPVKVEPTYIFKTGGQRKGKDITTFNEQRLLEFIASVDKMVDGGKPVSEEVQLDYNATLEFLGGVNA